MFAPVDPKIREKVIEFHLAGFGRNAIDRQLKEQEIKVSHGSISNIIKKYEQSLQSNTNINNINSPPSGVELGQQPKATINSATPMNITGSPILSGNGLANKVRNEGGPLNQLLCDDEEGVIPPVTIYSSSISTAPKPKPEFIDFDDKPYPEFYPVEPDVYIINQDANSPEEKETKPSNTEDPKPSPTIETWDPDSEESCERRVVRFIMDDKRWRRQELQLIENGKCELEEERQQIEQWNNEVQVREDKLNQTLNEIKPLLPSIRELQSNGITFDIIMPYMMAINEKSALENINLKTASWNMVHDFRDYRNLGGLRRVIAQAEQRLSELDMLITQRQAALNGITERLTQLTGSNYNDDNGHGDLSMTDYIRLNLLKGSTTNMLNRIGTTHMPFSLYF